MPKYLVKELSFIGNTLVQPGQEVDYDGEPGPNLEAADKAAKSAAAAIADVSKATADLVATLRLQAATRGDSPDNVNANDFQTVLERLKGVAAPSDATVQAAATLLGVTLPPASLV